MTVLILSFEPSGMGIYFAVLVFVLACFVTIYALYKKGDVRAELSHGRTVLKLEARERKGDRRLNS
jgi:hypothetical protein